MIYTIAVTLLKALGTLILVVILRAMWKNRQTQRTLARLTEQGIKNYPGNETFLFGSVASLAPLYYAEVAKQVMPQMLVWMMERLTEDTRQPGDPLIDATKNRMVAINLIGKVITVVQDPEVVAEMYNKHNANIDKHPWIG